MRARRGNLTIIGYLTGALATLLLSALGLWAQEPAGALSDLRSRVRKGDHIEVTAHDGNIIRGRFDVVADSSLRIRSGGRTQDIAGATITTIKKRRPDSNLNGLLIGLAVGAGAGVVAARTTCSSNDAECSAIATLVFVPIFAGGGAGVGALMDQLIHKYDPIYMSQTVGQPRLRLSPLVSKDKKGIRVTMSF
jgi:hypothetical protein